MILFQASHQKEYQKYQATLKQARLKRKHEKYNKPFANDGNKSNISIESLQESFDFGPDGDIDGGAEDGDVAAEADVGTGDGVGVGDEYDGEDDDIFEYYEIGSDDEETPNEPSNFDAFLPPGEMVKIENANQLLQPMETNENGYFEMNSNNINQVPVAEISHMQPKVEVLGNVVLTDGFQPFSMNARNRGSEADTTSKANRFFSF